MNIIGPPGGTLENSTVGWGKALANKSQYGTAPMVGTGTEMPLPSMPISQIWRYWWAVQNWRIQINVTLAFPGVSFNHQIDSGFVPVGTGLDISHGTPIALARTWLANGNGSPLKAPNLSERLTGFAKFATIKGCTNIFNGTGISLEVFPKVSLFGPVVNFTSPCMLIDDSTPGNLFLPLQAFMSFTDDFFIQTMKTDPTQVISPVTGNLDGIPFDFYQLSTLITGPYTQTGSFTITTRDN